MDKHLHIISLDVPFPADYGGVYDLFYKLPVLQQQGVKIHLHCFDKGRGEQPELNNYCEEVHYYNRTIGLKNYSSGLPYIVSSRNNEDLVNKLLKDDYPIFMEGIHCTYPLMDERFSNRKKFVRIHNVEHLYYRQLFSCSSHPLKKLYYFLESRSLKRYEQRIVNNATAFWAVTPQDMKYYHDELLCNSMDYLPLFLPPWKVDCKQGMGCYCLYHGNLEVEENEYAALWLLKHVFKHVDIPFVISGKNPSATLTKHAHAQANTCLVANPTEKELQDMIAKAQVHILPSFNNTGIKIKLLNALYNGRHCVVNTAMVKDTGLEDFCHIAEGENALVERITQLYHQPFTIEEIEARKKFLYSHYNNEASAVQIIKRIWD